jgi:Trypsin-like peptidase domain
MTDHPARARVAEIMVARTGGTGEEYARGSGYLVSPGWVLTAHHVVKDAASVGVWLGAPPELVSEAGVAVDVGRVLVVPAVDLALLPVGGPADDPLCEPALFGRLDRDTGPPVPVAAAGCPRFKLRPAPARPGVLLRELDYAIGSIAALSDAKTGRFAFAVDVPPGPDPEPGEHSPWEGMSGAAVWASGRLIGVVGQHHPREGLATLTVCPVEQILGSASENQLAAWHAALPQLPATAGNLWLATPPTARKIEVARARRAVEALSPRALLGRSAELVALEEFTRSNRRWRWIQGNAFAGKTALMAWFALHPPDRVDVAACFMRRASGEDTAEYALDVLTRQLALLAGRRDYLPPAFPSDRSNDFADLLEEAGRACAERDRQLLVLIDGLDEYDPTTASLDLADWLPGDSTLPDQATLIAASRAGADVRLPPGHPLSNSVQRITASEAATEIQQAAHAELDRAARTPGGFLLPLLCSLAAAGSGLTASDMRTLLKRRGRDADVSEIEAQLSSSLGRSLIRLPHPEDTGTHVYAFAHDTLLAEARLRFANDLATYEDLLDAWADEYAHDNWPIDTSQYLLAPYTRELARRARDRATPNTRRGRAMTGALDRLSALARSPSRHAFLLRATGSDYAALTEIRTAQSLIADQDTLELQALVELAAYRHALAMRSLSIPATLPIVWARLGRFDHAEALARAITEPGTQGRALSEVATVIAQAGDLDQAEELARTVSDADAQAQALRGVATAAAEAGDLDRAQALARNITDPGRQAAALAWVVAVIAEAADLDRAEALARAITDPGGRAPALIRVAAAVARAGDLDRARRLATDAETIARTITDPSAQFYALSEVATVIARAGDLDRAEALARMISDPRHQAVVLIGVGAAAAHVGDLDRARRLASDAEALARTITSPKSQAGVLAGVAVVAAQAGDLDRAEALVRTFADPRGQAEALTGVATAIAQAGDLDRAEALVRTISDPTRRAYAFWAVANAIALFGDLDRAEALACTITSPYVQACALTAVAAAAAQAGDLNRACRLATDAETLARTINAPGGHAGGLTAVAAAAAQAGDLDRAETLARTITDPASQAQALTGVATAIAQAGDLDRAEALARTITNPHGQAQALSGLAARAGDLDRGRRLASDAEALARTITNPQDQVGALTDVAAAAAHAGDLDRAETLVRAMTDPASQARALTVVATAAAQAGDLDRARRLATDAEALARTITDIYDQAGTLTGVATAAAQAGDLGWGETVARSITIPYDQAQAFTEVATSAAQAGDLDRAEALARNITDPYEHARALTRVATSAAQTGDLDGAEAVARTITDSASQARALTAVATGAARVGDLDRAEAVVRSITSPSDQAQALTGVATAAAQAGDLDRAGHLLAGALVTDPLQIGWVKTVCLFFPSAIEGAWDVLAGAYTTRG